MSTAALAVLAALLTAACALALAPAERALAKRGEPLVRQMVVKRDGETTLRTVPARRTTLEVEGRRCVVPAATALASLLQTRWRRRIGFHDYGSCSLRPADSAGLFVKRIAGDVNRGLDGWVYKVGRRLATAGAADPAGPFGSGRLRQGQEVVWFYCRFTEAASCQRSLEIDRSSSGREVSVTVTGYDDAGVGVPVAGARVGARAGPGGAGAVAARTGADGRAQLTLPRAGSYTLRATKATLVPAFPQRVEIG
jgi:hypothetical protein